MAVISVTKSEGPKSFNLHEIAPGTVQADTQIPRGTCQFADTQAIATLAAGNETQFALTLTFPANRYYLLKQASVMYRADNAESTTFSDVAIGEYVLDVFPQNVRFELVSNGNSGVGTALRSAKVWLPSVNYPRMFVNGSAGDSVILNFQDPDAAQDGQVAGDFFWTVEFWIYDEEQVRKAPINSPTPVISY